MDIKRIVVREGRAILIVAIIGVIFDLGITKIIDIIDQTSWRYYITVGSALWSAGSFIVIYYGIRFIIWAVKRLRRQ